MPRTKLRQFAALASFTAALALPAPALAETPRVVASIAPIHALTARVMEGVGTPELLLPAGTSPHGVTLRPSQAAMLEAADVVIYVSPNLETWLESPLESLAADAMHVELIETEGLMLLGYREGAIWEGHDDHDHGHGHGDDHHGEEHGEHGHGDEKHGEEEHAGHGHGDEHHDDEEHAGHGHGDEHHDDEEHAGHGHGDEKHGEEEHAGHGHGDEKHGEEEHAGHGHGDEHHDEDEHAGHGHEHGGTDVHIWLDPANAAVMVDAIAAALAEADPANAEAYLANAAEAKAELAALTEEVAAEMAALKGKGFLVFHDAYHYFEHRFGVEASGSVTISGEAIGAQRMAEIRARVENQDVSCLFAEPQFPSRVAERLASGTGAKLGTLDPLGSTLEPGADLYPALIRGIAASLTDCLS